LVGILKKCHKPFQLIKAIYNIYKVNVIAMKVEAQYSEWEAINQGAR
jgi:hypothetical protein